MPRSAVNSKKYVSMRKRIFLTVKDKCSVFKIESVLWIEKDCSQITSALLKVRTFETITVKKIWIMMNKRIEIALNEQIEKESSSSQFYLAMASWAENNGLNGTAKFMYQHADEERFHMLKLIKFVNERGGVAIVPAVPQPPVEFESIEKVFELLLEHELVVTQSINNVVDVCLQEKITRRTISCSGTYPSNWKKRR